MATTSRSSRRSEAVNGATDRGSWSASQFGWQFVRHAPHPMSLTSGEHHRLTAANPPFCELFGINHDESIGRPIAELVGGQAGRDLCSVLDRTMRSDEATTAHSTLRDGSVEYRLTVWPCTLETDGSRGLMVQVDGRLAAEKHESSDVATQMREVNERLLRAALAEQEWADRAEAASQAKSEFLAMVSHELRTPLTGVIAYTDLLLEPDVLGPLTRQQRESLERVESCASDLHQLIEDLLCVAVIDSGRVEIRVERIDAAQLARDAAAVVEPLAASKGLAMSVICPSRPLTVDTDPRRLRQILLNLIGNAAKFTDRGEVRVTARDESGTLRIDVEDTGAGIGADDLRRIFEPFVQTEEITTRRHGGTGLGLAISRGLARRMGGDITVSSAPGSGSTFSLLLPQVPTR